MEYKIEVNATPIWYQDKVNAGGRVSYYGYFGVVLSRQSDKHPWCNSYSNWFETAEDACRHLVQFVQNREDKFEVPVEQLEGGLVSCKVTPGEHPSNTFDKSVYFCPACGKILNYQSEDMHDNFCSNCGQPLNWSRVMLSSFVTE